MAGQIITQLSTWTAQVEPGSYPTNPEPDSVP